MEFHYIFSYHNENPRYIAEDAIHINFQEKSCVRNLITVIWSSGPGTILEAADVILSAIHSKVCVPKMIK